MNLRLHQPLQQGHHMHSSAHSEKSLCRLTPPTPQPFIPSLTQKEQEILEWCAKGKTSAEIAIILSRSETTINFHMANLRLKFDVTSRHAAVLKAIKLGITLLPWAELPGRSPRGKPWPHAPLPHLIKHHQLKNRGNYPLESLHQTNTLIPEYTPWQLK